MKKNNGFISLLAIVIKLCTGLPIATLHCKWSEAGRVLKKLKNGLCFSRPFYVLKKCSYISMKETSNNKGTV